MPFYHFCPPVIVGAVGGSGTRAVARVLAQAGYHIGADRNAAEDSEPVMKFYNVWLRPYLEQAGKFSPRQTRLAAADFTQAIEEHRSGMPDPAGRWVVKVPRNHLMLPFWQTQFPRACYLHVVRNGLDMAYSGDQNQLHLFGDLLLARAEKRLPLPQRLIAYWRNANLRALESARTCFAERYFVLRFEDLCLDLPSTLQKVSAFLASSIDFDAAAAEIVPPRSIGRWRDHPAAEIEDLIEQGEPALTRFGYRP